MANQGHYDDENDVFSSYEDDAAPSTQVTVREPSLPAPAPERQRVPAETTPSPREPAFDDEDDLGLMSDAINQIARAPLRSRGDLAVRTPVPTAPAPQQHQVPARTDTQDAPLTPREQALLRDLREERNRRQALERQPQQPAQPQQDFDTRFFSDPQSVINEVVQSFGAQLATVRLEGNLALAEVRHGTEPFKQAFTAYMDAVGGGQNLPLYQRVMTSSDPGEEIVSWYRENSVIQETGGDLNAFRERIRQELLAEMQGGQRVAAPAPVADLPRRENGQFAARHEVRLPTATSRMNGSGAGNEEMEDGSDDAIFDAGRSRRR